MTKEALTQYLKQHATAFDIDLGDDEISKFLDYKDLLISWNEKVNLTAITGEEEILLKHFVDSLTVLPYAQGKKSLIDVGTGAGFPGLPLKIVNRELKVTLMDSLNKRLKFLAAVTEALALSDVSLVHSRAEDGGQAPQHRGKYDIAISRAVAPLPVLCEYCLPFVRTGGCFIAMKGKMPQDELSDAKRAIKILGGVLDEVKNFHLAAEENERSILIIQKKKPTPREYPRKAGTPSKSPL